MTNNEMMRPCLPEGWELKEPFDANTFVDDDLCVEFITQAIGSEITGDYGLRFRGKVVDKGFFTYSDAQAEYRKAITTIADALNAPVLATEEVLAGLAKDAKVYTVDEKTGDALKCTFDNEFGWVCRTGHFNEALELGRPYKIFAINDPKTAEYLRQFTLQGVRKETNDV